MRFVQRVSQILVSGSFSTKNNKIPEQVIQPPQLQDPSQFPHRIPSTRIQCLARRPLRYHFLLHQDLSRKRMELILRNAINLKVVLQCNNTLTANKAGPM